MTSGHGREQCWGVWSIEKHRKPWDFGSLVKGLAVQKNGLTDLNVCYGSWQMVEADKDWMTIRMVGG